MSVLDANADHYTWVAAAIGSNQASGYQLATDDPVMAIGGFNGTDPSPTLAQFKDYVAQGKIHYFINGGMGGGGAGGAGAFGQSSSTNVVGDHHVGHQSLHFAHRRRRDALRPHVADDHDQRLKSGRRHRQHRDAHRSSIET